MKKATVRKLCTAVMVLVMLVASFPVTALAEENYQRLAGNTRFETSFAIADAMKEELKVDKFNTVILAQAYNFADALSGSYLAAVKKAPILLVSDAKIDAVKTYISQNMTADGMVYLLGGTNSVSEKVEASLSNFRTKRLSGPNRYETNLEILKEAGLQGREVLVCTGTGFADSLSASAVGKPILLVGKTLTEGQKSLLSGSSGRFVIIGGVNSVSTDVEAGLKAYGTVERLSGQSRHETSVLVAERFFNSPQKAALAYSMDFPDGLCGGPLAYSMGAPLLLTKAGAENVAASYTEKNGIHGGFVLGGQGLVSDQSAQIIFGGEVHTHSYTSKVTTEAKCETAGVKTFTCSCGDSYTESIPATGHAWGNWTVTKEPTETSSGLEERTCANCGEKESRPIDKTPHTHSYTSKVTTEAKCETAGVKTFSCSCGDSYTETIPATGHAWGAWKVTKKPTETSSGVEERICANCGEKETRAIDKTPHTHSYTSKVTTEAKCETAGVKTFTCSCGDSYTESIPAAGHAWGAWTVTKAPTETSSGLEERTCANCGEKESRPIDKTPHTHNYTSKVTTEAKCETAGVKTYTCTCGDSYTEAIPATGHSLTSIVTKPTCTTDGYTSHSCYICDYSAVDTKVPATGHSWSDWRTVTSPTENATGKAERTCSTCGTSETKTLDKLPHTHSYTKVVETVDSTCEKDGYVKKSCSCGDVKTEVIPAGHNWEHHHEDEVGHYETYIVCTCGWSCPAEGNYVIAFQAHVDSLPTEECYNHSYTDTSRWVVDTPAKDWDECTKCGATRETENSTHTHSYTKVAETVDATCEEEGYVRRTCSCGAGQIAVESATGHNWKHYHEDEVGHYDVRIVCHCGWSCSADGDYITAFTAHLESLPADERYDHSYYESTRWVVDTPAKDWDECTKCGAKK